MNSRRWTSGNTLVLPIFVGLLFNHSSQATPLGVSGFADRLASFGLVETARSWACKKIAQHNESYKAEILKHSSSPVRWLALLSTLSAEVRIKAAEVFLRHLTDLNPEDVFSEAWVSIDDASLKIEPSLTTSLELWAESQINGMPVVAMSKTTAKRQLIHAYWQLYGLAWLTLEESNWQALNLRYPHTTQKEKKMRASSLIRIVDFFEELPGIAEIDFEKVSLNRNNNVTLPKLINELVILGRDAHLENGGQLKFSDFDLQLVGFLKTNEFFLLLNTLDGPVTRSYEDSRKSFSLVTSAGSHKEQLKLCGQLIEKLRELKELTQDTKTRLKSLAKNLLSQTQILQDELSRMMPAWAASLDPEFSGRTFLSTNPEEIDEILQEGIEKMAMQQILEDLDPDHLNKIIDGLDDQLRSKLGK